MSPWVLSLLHILYIAMHLLDSVLSACILYWVNIVVIIGQYTTVQSCLPNLPTALCGSFVAFTNFIVREYETVFFLQFFLFLIPVSSDTYSTKEKQVSLEPQCTI